MTPEFVVPKILSGDGKSPETAVRFEPSTMMERLLAENEFLQGEFGVEGRDWSRGMQFARADQINEWQISLASGETRSVFISTESTTYPDE